MRINTYAKGLCFNEPFINSKNKNKNTASKKLSNKDTITLSSKGAKQLTHSTSDNRKIDSSIKISSYLEKVDMENQKTIDNADAELKAQVKYNDEFSAYEDILKDKYKKLSSIARGHENPEEYLSNKYFNKNSSYYVNDLSDAERRVAFSNELQMLTTGELSSCDLRDSAFRGLSKKEGLLSKSEGSFHRSLINSQFSKMLKKSTITGEFDMNVKINPYSYTVSVEDNKDGNSVVDEIKRILDKGRNASELFKHIIITSIDNGHNNKSITKDGEAKFDLYHQCLNGTGIDIRTLTEKNGTYYTKDGKDIVDVYKEAVDKSVENGNNYMPKEDVGNYKKWFESLAHLVSNKGWNNMDDMFLSIKVTNKGFVDLK